MATPAQMYDHRLNPLKGWPSPYALDKANAVGSATEEQGIRAGMVMHIDAATQLFKRGLPGNQVPIFAWNDYVHFDAMGGDDGNISLQGNMKGMSGLVALGAYELQTTEFVTGQTYSANTPLTVQNAATDDLGKVMPGNFYADAICGIVSDGQSTNANGSSVVAFWSYFLPSLHIQESSSLV
jgi:hypothetical protein